MSEANWLTGSAVRGLRDRSLSFGDNVGRLLDERERLLGLVKETADVLEIMSQTLFTHRCRLCRHLARHSAVCPSGRVLDEAHACLKAQDQ